MAGTCNSEDFDKALKFGLCCIGKGYFTLKAEQLDAIKCISMLQVNLLHPLATLEWKECREMPVDMSNAQAVFLKDKLYIGGGTASSDSSRLVIYDFINDSWEMLNTPTAWYSLTAYHSQLVLVGGVDSSTRMCTNKLWVLNEQQRWSQPFPPMQTNRFGASIVSIGDHLIVAGGCGDDPLNTVEVYNGHQWKKGQPLPKPCYWVRSTLYKGNFYLPGGMSREIIFTSLESLIATTHSDQGIEQTSVWKYLPDVPQIWSSLVTFQSHLMAVGGQYPQSSALHAYSHYTNSWVHAGELPVACYSPCALVLPTGELLAICGETDRKGSFRVFIAKIGVTSISDGHFDMSGLNRLDKVAGISIFNYLSPKFLTVAAALSLDKPTLENLSMMGNNPCEGSRAMLKEWISGKSPLPPTWNVLLSVVRLQQEDLAQKIEDFFNRTPVTGIWSGLPLSQVPKQKKEHSNAHELCPTEKKEWQTRPDFQEEAVQTSFDCCEVAVQTHGEATLSEGTSSIRGVEVVGDVSLTVPSQGGSFEWRGHGLSLHAPRCSLPTGMQECKITIKTGFSGQFQLPDVDLDFFSPVFWISAPCKFVKPFTLEIQHCALRDDTMLPDLNFISTSCSQRELPYKFTKLEGGVFSPYSFYGSIQLTHFSGVGIAGKKRTPRSYCAQIYYKTKGVHDWRFYFVVTQDIEIQIKAVREHYSYFAKLDTALKVTFQQSGITLDVPADGIVTKGGWKIVPRSYPTIMKKDVDCFIPGQWIPECELVLEWSKGCEQPTRLWHKVSLIGAKAPLNFFNLILDPTWERERAQVLSQATSAPRGPATGRESSSKPTLKQLMDALYHKVADRWKVIGVHLQISDLSSIETKHHSDSHQCLLEMLEVWLKRVDPPPTWIAMIEAIEFLGEEQLAKELRDKYIQPHGL